MNSKKFNLTNIKLFPIGLGTGFSDLEYKNPRKIIKIIEKSLDLGINLVDTAENYGNGKSETLIGKAIRGKRKKVFLATKFSPENDGYKKIIKSCEKSLKRLNTDYIDLYQIHWPNPKIPFEETAKALLKLKADGKIKFIGASNYTQTELIELENFLGKQKISSLQAEFNLYEHYIINSKILDYCAKKNISLIAYSPLDQGRIEYMNLEQRSFVNKLSRKYSKTTSQIILNWIISHGSIIPIPKTTNLIHLEENINAIKFKLTSSEYQQISKVFKPKIHKIKVTEIAISQKGERDRGGYQNIKEAKENKLNLIPGPLDLVKTITTTKYFKPIRLIPVKNQRNKKYLLINGRIRYWAWVIAFGNKKPIPSYIRNLS